MNIKQLTPNDVTITVTAEQEYITPAQYFKGLDNPTAIKDIEQQIETGNMYAWCTMKVKCKFMGLTATDYLGCCNYKSQQDFIDNSGYYQDMVNTCLRDLNIQIGNIVAAVVEQ